MQKIMPRLAVALTFGATLMATACSRGEREPERASAPPPVTHLVQPGPSGDSPFMPVIDRPFAEVFERAVADKHAVMQRQADLLAARYDLTNNPHASAMMTKGKPVQAGVRVRLPEDLSWSELAKTSPAEIRSRGIFPSGFLPLPHPNHPV